MDRLLQQKLESTLNECATHTKRLDYAHNNISQFLPAAADTIQTLTERQVEGLDQYIYRFTKLQDTMGDRLFNQSLQLLAEDTRDMAFIDKLNRLEQLGALRSAAEWMELRQMRNSLAHEYADNQQELAEGINAVFDSYTAMQQILEQFKRYIITYL